MVVLLIIPCQSSKGGIILNTKILILIISLIFMFSNVAIAEFSPLIFADLDVKVDFTNQQYFVIAEIEFIANNRMADIFLHLNNTISRISAKDQDLSWYTIGSRLVVKLDELTQVAGELHQIKIEYSGNIMDDKSGYSILNTELLSLRPAIYWLPVFPDLEQISLNYQMHITLPNDFTLISDGTIIEKSTLTDNTKYIIKGSGGEPILIAGKFETEKVDLGKTQVNYYYSLGKTENQKKISVIKNSSIDAITHYQNEFNLPFPEVLHILLFPNQSPSAEANIVFFPENLELHKNLATVDVSVYHELFHLILPTKIYTNQRWLSESLTHYIACKSVAKKYGIYSSEFKEAVMHWLQAGNQWHQALWHVPLTDSRYSSRAFDEYAPYLLYYRPALIFFTLELAIGQETMDQFWQDFFYNYWNSSISITTLRNELNRFIDYDLNWFFDDWIDGVVRPDYRIKSAITEYKDNYVTSVEVENIGTGRAVIPIIAYDKDDKIIAEEMVDLISSQTKKIRLITQTPIKSIEIDPTKLLIQTDLTNDIFVF